MLTDKAKEILYNLFCAALILTAAYLAYKYIWLDYISWFPMEATK